jgi:hypothetical protein
MNLRYALLAATVIATGASGVALAQRGPVYDPAQLPEVKGKVAQYLLTPRGDVDGLLLADGTEVHTGPRLSVQLVFAVKPGDAVTIHGLKAKATPMVLAAEVTNDATGTSVLASPRATMTQVDASGHVKAQLHTPRGDVDGVLLDDGTIVRLPPMEAQKFAAQLANGQELFVHGFGYAGPLGKVVAARSLGADKDHLQPVAGPHPPGPGGWMFGHRDMGARGREGMMRGREAHPGPMGGPMGGAGAAPAAPAQQQ